MQNNTGSLSWNLWLLQQQKKLKLDLIQWRNICLEFLGLAKSYFSLLVICLKKNVRANVLLLFYECFFYSSILQHHLHTFLLFGSITILTCTI